MDRTRITITNNPNEKDLGRIEKLRLTIEAVNLHISKEDDYNFIYRSKTKARETLTTTRKKLIESKDWNSDASICHHLKDLGISYYNAQARMSEVLY